MQVKRSDDSVFKPIRLEIILETNEEASLFTKLAGNNVTIPKALNEAGLLNGEDIIKLKSMMSQLVSYMR